MNGRPEHLSLFRRPDRAARVVYARLAPRAYSVIVFAALFCNLAVKFYHAARYDLLSEYPGWILTDLAVLLTVEIILAVLCCRRPTTRVIRGATVFAAVVCTWSVLNAGWLIRTGTQILPMELRPLIRDPITILVIVLRNLYSMPGPAAVLLIPSTVALAFFFSALARPAKPHYNRRRLRTRIVAASIVVAAATVGDLTVSHLGSTPIPAAGLRFNCQSRAVLSFLLPEYRRLRSIDFSNATRELPYHDEIPVALKPHSVNHNVVIVVLEGVQYDCTSLAALKGGMAPQAGRRQGGPTPYLASLAAEGVTFTNARSILTHTTKALFALLTGRPPSAVQDIAETVPREKPYASLATILEQSLGFRTAFFQSAKGTFESRPGLVHNLGFDTFWSRENLNDPNQFVGSLGSDEFAMIGPISDWIQSEDKPFLLAVLCSVTHDPYEVPQWFDARAEELVDRYLQTVSYTDRFIAALDTRLTNLGLRNDTIFCVVGDHGEAFGEHQMMGHERIAYEEVLRIVMCMRAPFLIEPGRQINEPTSSLDLTPTILGLLGHEMDPMEFAGSNALEPLPGNRRVFFSGWMEHGPAGYVRGQDKYIYDPEHSRVTLYRLGADPLELSGLDLPAHETERLSTDIVDWRRSTIFRLDEQAQGQEYLFHCWLCKYRGRESNVRYVEGK